MADKDVRNWIDGIKAAGELKIITGAEPKEEIGGIVDIYMRRMGNPTVMFDETPRRVLAAPLISRGAQSCRWLRVQGSLYARGPPRRVAIPCPRRGAACHFRAPQ